MFTSTNSCFVKDISLHEDGGQQTGKRKTITINKNPCTGQWVGGHPLWVGRLKTKKGSTVHWYHRITDNNYQNG